jgi:DNA-binding NarL/FixJ family response regulator
MNKQLKSVLIADESAMVRERLAALVRETIGGEMIREAGCVREARTLFLQCHPAAVILDLQLPDGTGLELVRRIKRTDPACLVLVLANYQDPVFKEECLRQGADYFLHKATEFEQAAELLRGINQGQPGGGAPELRPKSGAGSATARAALPSQSFSPGPSHVSLPVNPQPVMI